MASRWRVTRMVARAMRRGVVAGEVQQETQAGTARWGPSGRVQLPPPARWSVLECAVEAAASVYRVVP